MAEVLSHKEDIRTDFYITATYDSPFQLISERNEIWFLKIDRRRAIEHDTSPVLKYGSQRVEVPFMFSWILYLILGYFSFLVGACKTAFRVSTIVRDNWTGVKNRLSSFTVLDSVSLRALVRTGISVMLTIWSLSLGLLTGCLDMRGSTQWPKQQKGAKHRMH